METLKKRKAPGHDGIRTETLIEIKKEISEPLTHIINHCFVTGCFPDLLKLGVIKPLYKSGDKLEIINYRPISLVSNFAKIMEKIIYKRMMQFLLENKIIHENQYGFMSGRSTEDAIRKLTTNIYQYLDKQIPSLCIFVDLAKVFDTV